MHIKKIIATPPVVSTLILSMAISAFLIFLIQPMVGKIILPHLGGSSSIWATSLAFFTSALCLGYLYAYMLSRFEVKKQVKIHTILLACSLVVVAINTLSNTPVSMPVEWFTNPQYPALSIFLFLKFSIGLPYILLAASAPLLQQWYTHETKKEPYVLYSISNAGSLLALLSYPFVIEPYTSLYTQTLLWVTLFILFAYTLYKTAAHMKTVREVSAPYAPSLFRKEMISWVLLTALPAALLVASTTYITQVVAPIPLLWIIPLTIYLISFILAFGGLPMSPTLIIATLFSTAQTLFALLTDSYTIQGDIASILTTLFLTSTVIHQYVYSIRPNKELSSVFYVGTSLGGAIGSVLVSVGAPLILNGFFELHLSLLITAVVLVHIFTRLFVTAHVARIERLSIVCIALVCAFSYAQSLTEQQKNIEGVRERNFYGVTRVKQDDTSKYLYHGNTLHGEQFLDEERSLMPTSYYTKQSGVGSAILSSQSTRGKHGVRVGVIGLGTGTIASYCRPEDTYDYFEIDERMIRIAYLDFSYLSHCEDVSVFVGDGRIALQSAPQDVMYDTLAIDAFSDDSVPMHLITKEAIQLYMSRVHENGILAIHTSNRYIDLAAVVIRIAHELSLPITVVNDDGSADGASSSTWVLLAHTQKALESKLIQGVTPEYNIEKPLWRDDHINVFPVLYTPLSLSRITSLFSDNDE